MRYRLVMTVAVATLVCPAVFQAAFPAAQQQQQQPPPGQQKPPVFRAGATVVQVDAYPTRDGKIVEGLTAADFELFEDGTPQKVEDLQFVRTVMNTPVAERIDPSTQAEANRLAADPRNRVFVIYLDHYHVPITGSFRTRRPLVDMLNRLLTADDLFGVMTPLLRPSDLMLGRRTDTLEEQLTRHWAWGEKPDAGQTMFLEPHEQAFWQCYGQGGAEDLARRGRQDRVIQGLKALAIHLGGLREARKMLLLFTGGWKMYRPRESGMFPPALPRVGVSPGGSLTTQPPPGSADVARCNSEAMRLYAIDTMQDIRELLEIANRNNVSFYPVNPVGLEAPNPTGMSGSMTAGWDDIRDRWELLQTLAENTDGIAARSNDMGADLRRIADDVSAFYVLSYYSTNTKKDGKFRRIQVKVKTPDVDVKARRGYVAPSEAKDGAAPAPADRTVAPEVDEALGALTRLRPSVELHSYAVATPGSLAVIVELPADRALTGKWESGADVQVTVADASGAEVGRSQARLEPLSRGSLAHVALPPGSSGPWTVSTRVGDGATALADRIEVAPGRGALAGDAILFRARPPARAPLQPVADRQYRRTERLHVDWPRLADVDRREAQVLGRNGAPLAIPLTVTDRDVDGRRMLAVDLNLAPLTEGDYLIALTVGQGETSERKLVAFRVIR
jgi:VWFA-related protein